MAIYPYTNTYVINKDAVAGAQFKAGMVLMMNADGKAVPADSQLLVFNSLGQKLAKILGLSAGYSNLTGNTIIVPDTVGNNYLEKQFPFSPIYQYLGFSPMYFRNNLIGVLNRQLR